MSTIDTITVKAPTIRSRVMPKPKQVHRDKRHHQKKYACREQKHKRIDW
jgi:hypothetical protein